MRLSSLGGAFARLASPFRARRPELDFSSDPYLDLARRIEERAYLGSLEAQAYVEQRLRAVPSELGRHVEERALMASQEAKAYADSAAESLGMAARAMSRVVLQLSRRMDALEGAERQAPPLDERLTAVEQKLALLSDRLLAARAGELVAELDELTRRIDGRIDGEGRQQLNRIDGGLRSLAADLIDAEAAWAGSKGTGDATAAGGAIQRQSRT
jgi:hypothetical protein